MSDTTRPDLAFSRDDATRLLAEQPFCRWRGFEVASLGAGSCALRLPLRPDLIRPGGVLHGSGYVIATGTSQWSRSVPAGRLDVGSSYTASVRVTDAGGSTVVVGPTFTIV